MVQIKKNDDFGTIDERYACIRTIVPLGGEGEGRRQIIFIAWGRQIYNSFSKGHIYSERNESLDFLTFRKLFLLELV